MSRNRRLGKGMDALLQGREISLLEKGEVAVIMVPIIRLKPNPNQPRKTFSKESLQELALSIEEHGIIQPIIAEEQSNKDYLIIAGERRYRAAKIAGLTVVPVLPQIFSDTEKTEIALIENLQREDINPIEEAQAYKVLMESKLTQEEIALKVGRSRPYIANSMRLLQLPAGTQKLVQKGALSAGHARSLLMLTVIKHADDAAAAIIEKGLSVRNVEVLVRRVNAGESVKEVLKQLQGSMAEASADTPLEKTRKGKGGTSTKAPEIQSIEEKLIELLGTRVSIKGAGGKGAIEIVHHSLDDLERIVRIINPAIFD